MLKSEKGFTLIEIIAVLVILGILAAVAVPKYIDLSAQAKISAAQAEVAQLKSTLDLGYYKFFMQNGAAPTTGASVLAAASLSGVTTVGTAPDVWGVSFTTGATYVVASVLTRNSDAGYAASGTWNIPQ
jgi:MSHA pilin protein MshA